MTHIFKIALLFAISLLFTNCNFQEVQKACTLIGCDDGVQVKLTSSLPNSATIEINYDGKSKTIVCSEDRCNSNSYLFFENITPETFTIKIVENGKVLSESTHTPTYRVDQPNGPNCPPDCKRTEVSIAV